MQEHMLATKDNHEAYYVFLVSADLLEERGAPPHVVKYLRDAEKMFQLLRACRVFEDAPFGENWFEYATRNSYAALRDLESAYADAKEVMGLEMRLLELERATAALGD